MKIKYTTGVVSKICGVSVRTIQFYDKEGLLKPSEFTDGGRRLYNEEDIITLKCICLYKSLGFSLNEVKTIIKEKTNKEILLEFLQNQQKKLDEQIDYIKDSKKKLAIIEQELSENNSVEISSIAELNKIIISKNKKRKSDIMTYIFLGLYLIITITGFVIAINLGRIFPYIFTGIVIILLLALVYYHQINSTYLCQHCHKKFTITFLKDLFSLNGGKKGKYLKCPYCGNRGWFKETIYN